MCWLSFLTLANVFFLLRKKSIAVASFFGKCSWDIYFFVVPENIKYQIQTIIKRKPDFKCHLYVMILPVGNREFHLACVLWKKEEKSNYNEFTIDKNGITFTRVGCITSGNLGDVVVSVKFKISSSLVYPNSVRNP